MPLFSLSDEEAVGNRKTNPVAGWGGRGPSSRVEPLAAPSFEVPFRFKPGEKIFTIGSCFARNVEGELNRRGFALPMWDLFKRPEFAELNLSIINNYGTPSIYNEIAWAFGERDFVPDEHILEVRPGKFADIHVAPAIRPEPRDTVLARRRAIIEAYRMAAECSVVIMTLGLAELWFDTATGYYLNVAPRPSVIDAFPGRFRLDVLTYEEGYDYLEKAILILKKHAPELRIVLTVSPVPLMSTHRPMDVMVANTYSKSMLRTAAETIVARHAFVTYFPSYESVTLSDRELAWEGDLVHVKPDLVAFNVGRMIKAYVGGQDDDAQIDDAFTAIEQARAAREAGRAFADAFFERHGAWSATNGQFALEHARHLLASKRAAEAYDVLAAHDLSRANMAIMAGQALIALGRAAEARALLLPFAQTHRKSAVLWETLISAAMAEGDEDAVNALLWRYRASMTGRTTPTFLRVAKWFHGRGRTERALELAKAAMEETLINATALELSEFLIELGQLALARRALDMVATPNAVEVMRRDKLMAFLGGS